MQRKGGEEKLFQPETLNHTIISVLLCCHRENETQLKKKKNIQQKTWNEMRGDIPVMRDDGQID